MKMRKRVLSDLREIDGRLYRFRQIELRELMRLTTGEKVVNQVFLENVDQSMGGSNWWSHYSGRGWPCVEEAFLLTNGVIIASISVCVFNGTNHDDHTTTKMFVAEQITS